MKKKSFIYQTWWIGLIPMLVGFIFIIVATVNISAISDFRFIFLAVFGGSGLFIFMIGLLLIGYSKHQKVKNKWLKEQGIKMSAEVIDFQGTARTVNNNRLTRLTCTAKINGTDYIFKSQPLRLNPVPFLKNGLVDVYYDLGNMKRYFIDVDGSVRDVVEL